MVVLLSRMAGWRRGFWALLALSAGAAAPPADAPAPRPAQPPAELVEKTDVRLIQVAVSVTDPASGVYRSVPGLTLDQFDIRLDGKALTPEERQRIYFDPICEEPGGATPAGPSGEPVQRPVIAVIDFNYVDAAGRHKVAAALDALADSALDQRLLVKVYGLTRQVRQLTGGFTNERDEIRRAAEIVRETAFARGMLKPFSEGVPPRRIFSGTMSALSGAVAAGQPGGGSANAESGPDIRVSSFEDTPFQVLDSTGGAVGGVDVAGNPRESQLIELSSSWGDSLGFYDAGASLAALEGILRAHSQVPGRKIVVLFTSEAFRFARQERNDEETQGIREVARQGFTIWTVDAEGVGREQSGASELVSLLAGDTGGAAVRHTGDLARAFRGAAEQLSCYYLFSLPVPADPARTVEHNLVVKLDTDRFRELWRLRVDAPSRITVPDRAAVLRGRRIAALLSPDDFSRLGVSATLAYPTPKEDQSVLTARFRIPLRSLTWTPAPDGGVTARVLVDAVVDRDNGRGVDHVCMIGAEKWGPLDLRLKAPPGPGARAGFTVEAPCAFRQEGLYTARGVVTDLTAETSGAARSTAIIRRGGAHDWLAFSPRVEAASGLDYVWRPGWTTARLDRDRGAFRAVSDRAPGDSADRFALRYVLCGPDHLQAAAAIKHVLVQRAKDGSATVMQALPRDALILRTPADSGPFCAEASVVLAEFTLPPGRYAFAALTSEADSASAVRAVRVTGAGLPPGVLAVAPFTIAASR